MEHPQSLARIGVGYEKIDSDRTKPAIPPKRGNIERKLLLTAYIKSYTGFRLQPKCLTLNDLQTRSKVIHTVNDAKLTK